MNSKVYLNSNNIERRHTIAKIRILIKVTLSVYTLNSEDVKRSVNRGCTSCNLINITQEIHFLFESSKNSNLRNKFIIKNKTKTEDSSLFIVRQKMEKNQTFF